MATLDGYAPYPIGLTASQTVAAILRSHNLSTELVNYQNYFSQAAVPTTTKAGDVWRDADSNKVFVSTIEGSTTLWLEV
jgi:hypothetical protein